MEGVAPVETTGQVRWFKSPTPGMTSYMVSLDPAWVQVVIMPQYKFLNYLHLNKWAEWHHNTTPMNQQVRILQGITKHIHDAIMEKDATATPQIFYSMENNSIGEAALIESDGHR